MYIKAKFIIEGVKQGKPQLLGSMDWCEVGDRVQLVDGRVLEVVSTDVTDEEVEAKGKKLIFVYTKI